MFKTNFIGHEKNKPSDPYWENLTLILDYYSQTKLYRYISRLMKEIQSIIAKYDDYRVKGIKMAMATVVNVEQSSYRRSGARMLITEDGNWIGGISGGCLEGDTLKKAKHSILLNKPVKVTYDTRDGDPSQIGIGLGCNGLIDVLITPLKEDKNQTIDQLKVITQRRHPSILVTDLQTGAVIDCTYSVNSLHQLNDDIEQVKSSCQSIMTKSFGGHFIEFLPPTLSLYIFGKNYDVVPLAKLAKEVGWNINIIANPLKLSKQLHNAADYVFATESDLEHLDNYSIALLMSHDYKTDKLNLLQIQRHNLNYIGILGPKKRTMQILEELREESNCIKSDNIYGPMGLDTGATTPEEIAISIIAEIRSVYSKREGGYLRERKGSIHVS